jgi:hypothetical protein
MCWKDSSTRVPYGTYEGDCYLHILSTVGFINGIRTNCVSDVSIQWYFQRREELYHLLMSLRLFTLYIYTSWSLFSSVYLPDILTSLLICTHCSYYAIFHLNSWSPPSSPLHSTIPFFVTIKKCKVHLWLFVRQTFSRSVSRQCKPSSRSFFNLVLPLLSTRP